jgi:DNA-binding transcriptional ArsR family regulator
MMTLDTREPKHGLVLPFVSRKRHQTTLRAVEQFHRRPDIEFSVYDLARKLDVSAALMDLVLLELEEAGMLESRREQIRPGRARRFYRFRPGPPGHPRNYGGGIDGL